MYSSQYPPGPSGHFLLGSLKEFSQDLLGFLSKCAQDHRPISSFRLANRRIYLLSEPEDIKAVLETDQSLFHKHSFFWRHVQAIFGKGLLTSEGDHWKQQRDLMQPAFQGAKVAAYGAKMVQLTETMLDHWQDEEIRDIHQDMMELTAHIIHETLLGSRGNLPAEEIGGVLNTVTDEIAKRFRRPFFYPDWVPTPGNLRYGKAVRSLDTFIYGIIDDDNSTEKAKNNMVDLLLRAQNAKGNLLSRQQIRDEIITFFLAGHETTALALSWTWYLLSQHPQVEEQLHEELETVLGGVAPSYQSLNSLTYCEKVIQEAMRLYPPAYVLGREPIQPYQLRGFTLPPGSTIFICQWVVHRDPRFFTNPEAFEPERWTNTFSRNLPEFAYFPFGGGPRYCIGRYFAMMEAKLLLATIAQRYRLALVPGHPVVPLTSVTLRPKHGVKMVVRKRQQNPLP